MRNRFLLSLVALLTLFLCGACVSQAKALPLTVQVDENLPFTIALPEGWTLTEDPEKGSPHYLILPKGFEDTEDAFCVHLYFSKTEAQDLTASMEESSTRLEAWMKDLIDKDYEIYNKNDFRVDKNPAMALDFAKPVDESYLVGRVLLVTHPTHTIGFVAKANEANWNANVRTFDKIVESFKIKPETSQ